MFRLVATMKSAVRCRNSPLTQKLLLPDPVALARFDTVLQRRGMTEGLRCLDAGATWAFICAEDLDPVEVGQEPVVTSPQPDDGKLLCSGQLCDVFILSVLIPAILPKGVEVAPYDGTGFSSLKNRVTSSDLQCCEGLRKLFSF